MKKIISFILVSILMCTQSFTSLAASNTNPSNSNRVNQITELFSELMEYNLSKIEAGTQSSIIDANELAIQSELTALGVEPMTQSEVYAVFRSAGEIVPYVIKPENTNDIQYYTFRETQTVDGTTYEVQHISAIARTTNTNLAFSNASHAIYTNQNCTLDLLQDFASIYVQKAIGQVPIVGWLPYEFFFAEVTETSSANASYTGLTSAAFSFVKISGQDDYYQSLSLSSNYLRFSGSITATGARNGTPYTEHQDYNFSESGDDFCSTSAAITAYRNLGHYTSFVYNVTMNFAYRNGTPQYTCTLNVPTMMYLGQVF